MFFLYDCPGELDNVKVSLADLFPGFHAGRFITLFGTSAFLTQHLLLLRTAREMAEGGYARMLEEFGFHDHYQTFSGHCHQMTPALGAVLLLRGMEVHYLECARTDPENRRNPVRPELEEDPEKRREFCELGRIPYCVLEVRIRGHAHYLSPKHLDFSHDPVQPKLAPECYKNFQRGNDGPLFHADDPARSGIYLAYRPFPGQRRRKHDFSWLKRNRDAHPDDPGEVFFAFRRMKLVMPA